MSRKSVHSFEKGVNSDVSIRKQPKGTVRSAKNVEFLQQGTYTAVSNLKGSRRALEGSVGLNYNILAAVPCWGLVDSGCTGDYEKRRGIVYFEYDDTNLSGIRFFDIESEIAYPLYPSGADLDFPPDGTVDARYYADRSKHYIYFNDHKNVFRQIEVKVHGVACEVFPALKELTVRPLHPIDCIRPQITPVEAGGALLPGSYIVVYRYFNSVTCRSSGWSNPTNPIPVIPEEGEATDVLPGSTGQFGYASNQWGGRVGQNTNKKLKLEISTTLGNAAYDSIQLLVIPMVDGAKTTPTTGLLTNPSKEWYNTPGNIEFDGNDYTVVDLSDYLVDDIPLVSAKTMEIKDNRIFLGNFKTRDFDFDNGDPTELQNAETVTATADYRNETECTFLKGYFRDELYGFGIFYYDEFGNGVVCPYDFTAFGSGKVTPTGEFMEIIADLGDGLYEARINMANLGSYDGSDVIELNGERATVVEIRPDNPAVNIATIILRAETTMTVGSNGGVTYIGGGNCNQGSGWAWKFPSRHQKGFSLFSDVSDNPVALGLRLEGISNHPSWAKGFRIVRLKRKRDKLGQFLHVPAIAVNGNRTPGLESEGVEDEDYSGAQDTFLPKVHMLGTARNLEKYQFDNPLDLSQQLSVLRWQRQNAINTSNEIIPLMSALIPEYMYNIDGESFDLRDSAGAKLSIADAVLLRYYEDKQELFGARIKETVTRYSAFRKDQYFYNHENRIVENGVSVLYKKLEDTNGFQDSIAKNNVGIDWQLEMAYDSAFVTVPGYRPSHSAYEHILSFGRLIELISNQGSHPSIPGWIAKVFYNLLNGQNQRQFLLKSTAPIIDFTTTVWDRTLNTPDEYFPLNAWTPHINVIDDVFLQTDIATVPVEYEFTPAVVNEDYAGAAYIFDVIKGLGDDRYGDIGSIQGEWIDTGVCQALTDADIIAGTPFNVNVWGGDCFITRHSFKVSESVPMPATYNPVDSEIDNTGFPAGSYMKTGKTSVGVEVVECWLESEVNSAYVFNDGKYPQRGLLTDAPPPANLDISVSPLRGKFEHYYNPGYSMQFPKVYAEKIEFCDERTEFKDSILWSDVRVRGAINTPLNDVDGFDKFRSNNVWVLDSKYGDVIKMITLEDQALHILQEKRIAFQPVGVDEIRTQNGNLISTGTGNVLGTGDFYLPYDIGTQHMRTVVEYDGRIYGVDALRGMAYVFGTRGSGFKAFSMDGFDKKFRELVQQQQFLEKELVSIIDPVREKLWINFDTGVIIGFNGISVGYSLRGEYWEGEYDYFFSGGTGIDNKLFLNNRLGSIYQMYDGPLNNLVGQDVIPSIDIVMNDYETVTKVLQNVEIAATNMPLSTQFFTVDHDEGTPDQATQVLDMRDRHNRGYFENRIVSVDADGYDQKLRGKCFLIRINFDRIPSRDLDVVISSVVSMFRESK